MTKIILASEKRQGARVCYLDSSSDDKLKRLMWNKIENASWDAKERTLSLFNKYLEKMSGGGNARILVFIDNASEDVFRNFSQWQPQETRSCRPTVIIACRGKNTLQQCGPTRKVIDFSRPFTIPEVKQFFQIISQREQGRFTDENIADAFASHKSRYMAAAPDHNKALKMFALNPVWLRRFALWVYSDEVISTQQ